jgi:hypothetical protein
MTTYDCRVEYGSCALSLEEYRDPSLRIGISKRPSYFATSFCFSRMLTSRSTQA